MTPAPGELAVTLAVTTTVLVATTVEGLADDGTKVVLDTELALVVMGQPSVWFPYE